ncbi:hypothetical protein PAESOLCIP111_01715 [Paenibacillus solanacearum]|uniref:Uncharacterized protein n=1 Tax=Paenibacillus solanacearum TaxID=2048548 RepID=A0A916JY68_9BACL|nr:CBO0543 family protein [Paenibacillus solanacearum]CAG7614492.1 hypothetical protein PAESOLCIP111_01715 [Paenibacillus solanacearum]
MIIRSSHITKAFEEVQKAREQLHQLDYKQWMDESLFTWEWFLLAGLTTIPLILWWIILDKKRAYEIAFYGCMINIMAIILDDFGTNLAWWGYPIKLLPTIPPLLTADSILVPIVLMIIYQMFSTNWKKHLIANAITAAFLAFIAEPIFIWIGYYQLNSWKLLFSFLFYNAASALARFIIMKIGTRTGA